MKVGYPANEERTKPLTTTDTPIRTLTSAQVCTILGISETKLHRLSKLYGYEHGGSGRYTEYLAADIPAFKAILAAQEFSRGGDISGTRQGLPPAMLADLGRQYAEHRKAEVSDCVNGIVITITMDAT